MKENKGTVTFTCRVVGFRGKLVGVSVSRRLDVQGIDTTSLLSDCATRSRTKAIWGQGDMFLAFMSWGRS